MTARQSEDTPPASEAPSEGRFLTAEEIASELGQPLYLVRRVVTVLKAKIPWRQQEGEGRRAGPRLYHESGLAAIVQEIGKRRRRAPKQEDAAKAAYWRARASLRLLKRDANAFAEVARGIYELLKKNPPSERVVVHALPHSDLILQGPVTFRLRLIRGRLWQATLPDLPLLGNGKTQEAATQAALKKLGDVYLSLEEDPSVDPEMWHLLTQLVRRLDRSETIAAQTVIVESEAALTVGEWLDENAPEQNESLSLAWRRGACARLYGRSPCRYREPKLIEAWNGGFATMSRYLEAGGAVACSSCLRPLADRSNLAKAGVS